MEYRILKVMNEFGNSSFYAQVKRHWFFGLIPRWVYLDAHGFECDGRIFFPFDAYCERRAQCMIDDHRKKVPVSSEVVSK